MGDCVRSLTLGTTCPTVIREGHQGVAFALYLDGETGRGDPASGKGPDGGRAQKPGISEAWQEGSMAPLHSFVLGRWREEEESILCVRHQESGSEVRRTDTGR